MKPIGVWFRIQNLSRFVQKYLSEPTLTHSITFGPSYHIFEMFLTGFKFDSGVNIVAYTFIFKLVEYVITNVT